MKRIEILVAPSGETQITTNGFAGAECQQASRFLEAALGKRTRESLTAEFHQQAHQTQRCEEHR